MIEIETHKIIDLIESREEDDVAAWLSIYPNIEVISRDGGLIYKNASNKSHPNAKQVSDRFHMLKNLTDYAKDALKRLLKKQIIIEENKKDEEKELKKSKYNYKTKWDLIVAVKKLKRQGYKIDKIGERLGISTKTVIKYNNIDETEKEKYNKLPPQEIKSKIIQERKWKLIQEVQKDYKRCNNCSEVARKFKINRRTVKEYLKISTPPISGNKSRVYPSKLNKYKSEIIEKVNKGFSFKIIYEAIKLKGYNGSSVLLRHYIAKIKRENIKVSTIKQVVERSSMVSLLYKEIEEVKNITKETFEKVINTLPEVKLVYNIVKEFKEIVFSKNEEKLTYWIEKAKAIDIPEINSFIIGIEKDIEAIRNGIKYSYNNGLAEGSVNKIKVIKRIMYGRCSFELLKKKILLQYN